MDLHEGGHRARGSRVAPWWMEDALWSLRGDADCGRARLQGLHRNHSLPVGVSAIVKSSFERETEAQSE